MQRPVVQDMMVPPSACPDENDLAGFVEGALDEVRVEAIEDHLSDCPTCRVLVSEVAREPLRHGAASDGAAAALPRGQTVGRYLLLEHLGSGGMGAVYVAYDPELDRKVAVKLLHPATTGDAGDQRQRLLREAQVMAQLSHPHLCPVFDVGTFGERLFVAMEYVPGGNLRHWLREQAPERDAIVRAFADAGRGLAAAHAAGIVHRDFKPDNVLRGDDGRVRVTDFGLARVQDTVELAGEPEAGAEARMTTTASTPAPHSVKHAPLTEAGMILGTPAYMAPEQRAGGTATTGSDQYSFCMALDEALHGHRARATAAATKGRLPGRLRRVLDRGLRPDPGERYPSVNAVVTELDAYLRRTQLRLIGAGLGIVGGVLTAALVAARILSPAVTCDGEVHSRGLWTAERQQTIATAFLASHLTYAASTHAAVSRQLESYLERWHEGYRDACEATAVRREQSEHVLDLRIGCLKEKLADVAALIDVLAAADATVVEHAQSAIAALPALAHCDSIAALGSRIPPVPGAMTTAVAALRTQLAQARALGSTGKLTEAKVLAQQTHAASMETTYLPVQAEAALVLAGALVDHRELDAASALYDEAMGAADAAHDDPLRAAAAVQLVGVLSSRTETTDAALAAGKRARRIIERLRGDDTLLADLLQNESRALSKAARHAEALEAYQASIASRVRAGGDVAESACRLAGIYSDLGRLDEAGAAYDACYQAVRRRLGDEHPRLMESLNGRAIIELQQGHFASGERLLRTFLRIGDRALGRDHAAMAPAYTNLGHALREQGRGEEALQAFNQALLRHRRARGADDPLSGVFIANAGLVAYDDQRWRDVDAAYLEALRILATAKKPAGYAFFTGNVETQLGDSLLAQGRAVEAKRRYRAALTHIEGSVGSHHPQLVLTLTGLGRSELALGEVKAARQVLARAVELARASGGSPFDLAAAQFAWVQAETAAGVPTAELRDVVVQSQATLRRAGTSTRPTLRAIDEWLATR
ncbi:MAG: serine/threonine-protein kinase [Myxococcota bacterium]